MTEVWLEEIACDFWSAAGECESYPRDMTRAIFALPVTIVELEQLSVSMVCSWFRKRGFVYIPPCSERSLSGCLVAYGGHGVIFVDASDNEDEKRYSLAHETSHFIVDYSNIRKESVAKLGACVLDVLDGRRTPTISERVDALLSKAPIGVFSNFMDREADGTMRGTVTQAEYRADLLAFELLAPARDVMLRLRTQIKGFPVLVQRQEVSDALTAYYGLPLNAAKTYALRLIPDQNTTDTIRDWLGLK